LVLESTTKGRKDRTRFALEVVGVNPVLAAAITLGAIIVLVSLLGFLGWRTVWLARDWKKRTAGLRLFALGCLVILVLFGTTGYLLAKADLDVRRAQRAIQPICPPGRECLPCPDGDGFCFFCPGGEGLCSAACQPPDPSPTVTMATHALNQPAFMCLWLLVLSVALSLLPDLAVALKGFPVRPLVSSGMVLYVLGLFVLGMGFAGHSASEVWRGPFGIAVSYSVFWWWPLVAALALNIDSAVLAV
jgi:hypothetical protein